jgi:hypothetical protein
MLAVKSIFSLKVFSLHTGNVVNPQIENLSYGCYLPSQYDMVPTETLTEQRKTIENCKKCRVTPKGKLTNTTFDLLAKKLTVMKAWNDIFQALWVITVITISSKVIL